MAPGDRLVMYSDGLVERRNATIDEGLDRLARSLTTAPDLTASEISEVMASTASDDDITILTLCHLRR